MLLEKTNERIRARSTVQPESERRLLWILAGLKEPKEHIRLLVEADVTGIVIDTFGGLADALLSGLLVPDLCALRRSDGSDTRSIGRYLTFDEGSRTSCAQRSGCQDGGELCETGHYDDLNEWG